MTKKLVIVRGIPGSGKSTRAKQIADEIGAKHFEADMYFVGADGVYRFDRASLSNAHAWCLGQAQRAMLRAESVVVANTFTRRWEIQPYLDSAKEMGYEVEEVVCRESFGSVHGVPSDAIARMASNWED